MNEKLPAPILIVENSHGHGVSLGRAIRAAGINHPLLRLPDAASAELYLSGTGSFSDRRKYPLPCLVMMDVTLPNLAPGGALPWLQPPPVSRQIIVTRASGPLDPGQFESAGAFGPNSMLCKLTGAESLVALMNLLRDTLPATEEPALAVS